MRLHPFPKFLLTPFLIFILLGLSLPAMAARNILILGDSLSAGYGIPVESAWPSLLQERLKKQAPDYNVVNLSISGETTAGGRTRLSAALTEHQPALVILALGANDGLRGLSLLQTRDNLEAMIQITRRTGARVLLVGMRLPPNYGSYADKFADLYPTLARQYKLPLVKFLLEGIADKRQLFQADGLHPTAVAQRRILDNVWPSLKPQLR